MEAVAEEQKEIRVFVEEVKKVNETLDPVTGKMDERKEKFEQLMHDFQKKEESTYQHMGKLMKSFLPGLFTGDDNLDFPRDNLDLERFFRIPKGHERRIHGHRHAGIRIVIEGAMLLPTLDAHQKHQGLFSKEELLPFVKKNKIPQTQKEAENRRKTMRKARSKKQRPNLLKELETRYLSC